LDDPPPLATLSHRQFFQKNFKRFLMFFSYFKTQQMYLFIVVTPDTVSGAVRSPKKY